MAQVSTAFAQQIVDSAKAVVGWDVNFIDSKGIILASTNPNRIGKYHEAGHEAARTRKIREVVSDNSYKGSPCGINYPIIMEGKVVGVIGITGDPAVVAQYGFLLTKICEVFLKEYSKEVRSLNERQHTNKLVLSLLYNDKESLGTMEEGSIDINEKYAVSEFFIDCHGDGTEQSRVEGAVVDEMRRFGLGLYTFIYPNEMVCLVPESLYGRWKRRVTVWESLYGMVMRGGIGTIEAVQDISVSYRFSKLALRYAADHQIFCMLAEDMDLELLLQSVDESIRRQYWKRICGSLPEEDIHLLQVYFHNNLSLQETSTELVIHKNTLQYRLKRIRSKTGLDPRKFSEAVVLYIALRIGC